MEETLHSELNPIRPSEKVAANGFEGFLAIGKMREFRLELRKGYSSRGQKDLAPDSARTCVNSGVF
jgi:hypothetical protein